MPEHTGIMFETEQAAVFVWADWGSDGEVIAYVCHAGGQRIVAYHGAPPACLLQI